MFHFCIMGGHEGELSADQKICFTMFGACELKRPTLASRVLEARRHDHGGLTKRTHFFITICGATELTTPTLAEEYLAMREVLDSGVITVQEWDSAVATLSSDEAFRCGSFTMMGAFSGDELPGENEEIDSLAVSRHLGRIDEHAGRTLELGVGRGGAERTAILRQAMSPPHPAAAV